MKDDLLMDDTFNMKNHFIKTAQNYFLVERFLSLTKGVQLSPLTRLALMLMLEPDCPMTSGRLATKMDVSEIYALAALEELVSVGFVRQVTYARDSYYKFTTDMIDHLNQTDEAEYAERQAAARSGFDELL